MTMFKNLTPEQFHTRFATRENCLLYLSERKWKEGYRCRKCGNGNYCQGRSPFSRRCTRCKHDESATAHTPFHGCHLSLPDAFLLAFVVCNQPDISTHALSRKFSTRQMTCWKMKKKIALCIEGGAD